MRRYWKITRFVVSIISRTAVLYSVVPFAPSQNLTRARHQRRACAALCRILGVRVVANGPLPETSALVVSNHLGPIDPLIIASVMDVTFAGKAELLRSPVVAWICRTVGLIAVHRDRRMKTNDFVEQVRQRLESHVSVVVFPEGTTSSGATVLPFKTGAFAAVDGLAAVSVLPICINVVNLVSSGGGLEKPNFFAWTDPRSMSEYAWDILGLSEVEIEIGVATPIFADNDRKVLAKQCREAVVAMHKRPTKLCRTFE